MNFMEKAKIKNILEVGVINTIRINFYYFGIKGIICPYIIASRNLKLKTLKGKVIVNNRTIGAIKIGFGSVGILDKKYCRTLWENKGIIEFLGTSNLGAGSRIACIGHLILGDKTFINGNSSIICRKKVIIGDNTVFSWECLIMDTDFHEIRDIGDSTIKNPDRDIVIGKYVWIGCRTTILKGSVIADNSVIAACSVVTGTLDKGNTVYVSNSPKISNIKWNY